MSDEPRVPFATHSFSECVARDPELAGLRRTFARQSPETRRQAADWAYHAGIADSLFQHALETSGQDEWRQSRWPDGVEALAIDPKYAPALLTVGSLEHQLGHKAEAMRHFMALTTLASDEADLSEIIDKAAVFLVHAGDAACAYELQAEAEALRPDLFIHHAGLNYCLGKMGMWREAVAAARRAVDLEPRNPLHWNDLGWSLHLARYHRQAEQALRQAIKLASDDYDLARENLKIVRKALKGDKRRGDTVFRDRMAAFEDGLRRRNEEIVRTRRCGATAAETGRLFHITGSRVMQIVRRADEERAGVLRNVRFLARIRDADDPDRIWPAEDLIRLFGLFPHEKMPWLKRGKPLVNASLRDLMDFVLVPREGNLVGRLRSPLLDLRGVSITHLFSVIDRLSVLDLGPCCKAAWAPRAAKYEERRRYA